MIALIRRRHRDGVAVTCCCAEMHEAYDALDGNAEALSIKGIEALAVTAESDKFYGYRGAKAQGMKAPGGFGIVVTASGVKSFVLHYRIAGRERRYTIGHCSTWQAAKAIKAARELRQRIETGDDPLLDHAPLAEPIKQPTVKEIHEAWLNRPKLRDKPNTPQRLSFARHTLPFKLGDGCNALTLGAIPHRGLRKSQEAELQTPFPWRWGHAQRATRQGRIR